MATPRKPKPGPVVEATQLRLAELAEPDVALVALAYHLARQLDTNDPKRGSTAATAKEYRAVINQLLVAGRAEELSLEQLDDEVA